MLLSTSDISNLMYPTLDMNKTAQLCKTGELFAWKDPNAKGPIKPWIIPSESFAYFLSLHRDYWQAFYESNEFIREEETNALKRKLLREVERIKKQEGERYSYSQLSLIFDVPLNTIASWFKPYTRLRWNPKALFAPGQQSIPDINVMHFLKDHPERYEALQERHGMLLASGALEESAVRHLLMNYAYYQSNNKI